MHRIHACWSKGLRNGFGMDTSSRRAFALDSRTVWVEQQILKQNNIIVAKDNFVLGPGEYNAKILERHIFTPVLGGSKRSADFFIPFRNDLHIRSPTCKGSPSRSNVNINKCRSEVSLRDFSSIFHDNDKRQPLDPKNGFCPTPGPYCSQDSVLKMVKTDGVFATKSAIQYDLITTPVPFGERCPTRTALPDYEPHYDSVQLKPVAKFGTFNKEKRIYIPSAESQKARSCSPNEERESTTSKRRILIDNNHQLRKDVSVFEARCNSVPLPKLKYRAKQVLVFDASSYQKSCKPLDLNPKLVNNEAKVNVYGKLMSIPRKHQSSHFLSKSHSMSDDEVLSKQQQR